MFTSKGKYYAVCGDLESEKHVLLDCNIYMDVRRRWTEKMNAEHANIYIYLYIYIYIYIYIYEAIQVYEVNNECIEKETMCYLGMVWSASQRSELSILV